MERMHKELGQLCRIYGVKPNEAVQFVWDHESCMIFMQSVSVRHQREILSVLKRGFSVGGLVWRKVDFRQRSKGESMYKGPYAIKEVLGELQYTLSGKGNHPPKVSVNNIKEVKVPITDHWGK